MDSARAKMLASTLVGKEISGWLISELIDQGKSAAVFLGRRGTEIAAVKIFDQELIERFGKDIQLARIERELLLRGKGDKNLVRIIDGGHDPLSDAYFVAMEFVSAKNLASQLDSIEDTDIPGIVEQLAQAARYLEGEGLVHRDIKPSNVAWCPAKKKLTLLDLGVLGPVGEVGQLTDIHGRAFIGTLQYSSPEYLLRNETDTVDGWRALTFYQIGAVMHDLIMKKTIFSEFQEPYGRLVNAVQHEQPIIQNTSINPKIVELARRCLVKKPDLRLALVSWSSFDGLSGESKSSAKQRVTNRTMMSVAAHSENVSKIDEARQRTKLEAEVSAFLRASIRAIRRDNSIFPPVNVSLDRRLEGTVVKFDASIRHGLPVGMKILIKCNVLDASEQVIELTGLLLKSEDEVSFEVSFFKGVIDTQAMYSDLENFVYSMLDAEQNKERE